MVSDLRPSLLGRYRILGQLSTSSTHAVLLAEDSRHGGRRSALKLSAVSGPRAFELARREFEILRRLHHPGVAEVFDFGQLEPREIEGSPFFPRLAGNRAPDAERLAYIASVYYEGLHLRDAFLRLFPPAAAVHSGAGESRERRWQVFLEALALLCEALDAVHSQGLIHYDIKPENLLLIPNTPEGTPSAFEVKILDFGLSEVETTPVGTRLRGTIPFLAPEILESATADRRSDLFSFGVAIACAVSGRFPFPGSTPERWLIAARRGRLVDLRKSCPEAPPGFLELVGRLLQPQPQDRPPDALAVLAHLERAGGFTLAPRKRHPARLVPRAAWRQEIALLEGELERLKRAESEKALILLEGDAGQFHTQILDEVEAMARAEAIWVHTGGCRLPRRYPHQPFAEIVHRLSHEIDLTGPRWRRFAPVLSFLAPVALPPADPLPPLPARLESSRIIDLVTELFLQVARQTPLVLCFRDLQLAGRETLEILRSLARNIHLSACGPEENVPGEALDPPRLLLVGTLSEAEGAREAEAETAESLSLLEEILTEPHVLRVRLKNVALDQLPEWLRERAPLLKPSGEFLRRLHEKTGGAPRLLDEFVRRLLEKPEQRRGKELEADPDLFLSLPRTAEDSALERLANQPAPERRLVEILAVAHGPLTVDEIAAFPSQAEGSEEEPWRFFPAAGGFVRLEAGGSLDGAAPESTYSKLKRLEQQGFVELRDGAEGVEASISFPSFSEHVYRQMREESRVNAHRELALLLLDQARQHLPNRIHEDVTFHARLGGWTTLYLDQVVITADRLAEAQAYGAALRLYEEVLDRLSSVSGTDVVRPAPGEPGGGSVTSSLPPRPDVEGLRYLINERLARIYRDRGQLQRALEKLTVLSSLLEGFAETVHRASVYRHMGEIYQQCGEMGNASYFLEKSLKLLHQAAGPRDAAAASPAAGARLAASALVASSRTSAADKTVEETIATLLALARYRLQREEVEPAAAVLEECCEIAGRQPIQRQALSRASMLQAEIERRQSNHAASLDLNLKALELARESGDLALYSEALGAVGANHVARGAYDEAIARFQERLEVARRLESKYEQALAYSSLGTVYHNRCDHQRALEFYTRSLQLKRQTGDLRGIANSYNNLGIVYQVKDDLAQASECYKRSIDLFSRTGDQQGMATGMNNLSSILELEGKYGEALDYSFRALEKRKKLRSRSGMAFSYYRVGRIYQSRGELDKAMAYAERSLSLRQELGEKLGVAYSRLQLAELFLAGADYRRALRLCRLGLKDFSSLENEIGVLLAREILARVLWRLGEGGGARQTLLAVLERARSLEQRLLVGSSLLTLGRIAAENGDLSGAEARLREAEKLFRANRNQRELAEALLGRSALELFRRQPRNAAPLLEEAYSVLEKIGVRDLVPAYFLLRSRLELEVADGNLDAANKFLERGLVETREINLPELRWRIHSRLGHLGTRAGDARLGRIHFQEAQEILDEIASKLPPLFRRRYLSQREILEWKSASGSFESSPPEDRRGAPAQTGVAVYDGDAAQAVIEARRTPFPPHIVAVLGAADAAGKRPIRPAPETGGQRSPTTVSGAGEGGGFFATAENTAAILFHRQILKLHEVAAAVGAERNLQKLLEFVMDAVLELVDAERGFLLLRTSGGGETTITVARNLDRGQVLEPEHRLSASVAQEVLLSGKPVLAGNALAEGRFLASKSIHELRLRSLVCVPLKFREEVLGIIYLDNRHRRQAFHEDDLKMLQAFADQAAVAVTNARLIDENQKRNAELLEANRQKEILNLKLRRKVQQRSAQLALAREDLRDRQLQLEDRYRFQNMVGRAQPMQEIFNLLGRVAPTNLPVLLEGESGTGKELMAHAIHFNSGRKDERFVSENCGALTESLLESELFGHVRGAFTGAIADQKGLFELAHNGTLFLDEVGSMSSPMQQKLLRVLEEGEVRRVGGKDKIPVNVRIISASNRDLRLLVAEGKFREDLYYRLNGVRIRVPNLRERQEDIPLLVEHFLQQAAARRGATPSRLDPNAMRALIQRDWPGNVRELRHFVEKTLLIAPGEVIRVEDLLFDAPPVRETPPAAPAAAPAPAEAAGEARTPERRHGIAAGPGAPEPLPLRSAKERFEREFLRRRMEECHGNVSLLARSSGVSRETLYRLFRKHGIVVQRGE